jgi:hypothetical protein
MILVTSTFGERWWVNEQREATDHEGNVAIEKLSTLLTKNMTVVREVDLAFCVTTERGSIFMPSDERVGRQALKPFSSRMTSPSVEWDFVLYAGNNALKYALLHTEGGGRSLKPVQKHLHLTTGHFSLRSAFINSGPTFKVSSTSSRGVSAIHWFSDTSA